MSDEPIKPLTRERTVILLHRACSVIMGEWGYDRERTLAWLSEDDYDWTPPAPQPDCPPTLEGKPWPFIQVSRTFNVSAPGLTTMRETILTPAMIDEIGRQENRERP